MRKTKWLLYLIGLFLLARVLSGIKWSEFYLVFSGFGLETIVLSVFFLAISIHIRSQRFYLCLDQKISRSSAQSIFYLSQFFGQITPGRIGEFSKVKLLTDQGVDTTQSIRILIQDRFFDFLILFTGFLGIFLGQALWLIPVITIFHWKVSCYWFSMMRQGLYYVSILFLTLCSYLFFVLSFATYFFSAGLQEAWLKLMATVFSATLVAWVPISWQGLGTKEQVYLAVWDQHAVETLLAVSLAHFLSTVLGSLFICGIGVFFCRSRS